MDRDKEILHDEKKGGRVKAFNRDLMVFTFFLFLSFTFWYLNSLKKESELELKYPVKFINPPKNREFSEGMPSKISILISGHGYSIIKLKLSGNRAPLVIDLSRVSYKKVTGTAKPDYYIVSHNLSANFSKQLTSEFKIVSVKPDTLFFSLPVQAKVKAHN
jgi:hypothetical protein